MLRRSPLKSKRDTPRRNEGRITHGRIKERGKVTAKGVEKIHMDRIAAMPCVVTGRKPVVIHHIMSHPLKKRRRDHRFIVPLVPEMHNMGNHSVHALGSEQAFQKRHGIDLVAWATQQWNITNEA